MNISSIKNNKTEKFEDKLDIELFDHAYLEFLKNPKAYTCDETAKLLGISIES